MASAQATQASGIRETVSRWPVGVAAVFLALEAMDRTDFIEGRKAPRSKYNVAGTLRLDGPGKSVGSIAVHTRDISSYTVGFVTDELPGIGRGGTLQLLGPDGTPLEVGVCIYRWREIVPEWYEAAAHFNACQPVFGEYNLP
jgi:hypothetical protein